MSARFVAVLAAGIVLAPPAAHAQMPVESAAEQAEESPESAPPVEVPDARLRAKLSRIYASLDRFAKIDSEVVHGVVRLRGEVESRDDAEAAVEIARNMPGVIYVANELTEPTEVAGRLAPLERRLDSWATRLVSITPLVALAVMVLMSAWLLGRLISSRDFIYQRLIKNPLLRDIYRKITRIAFATAGLVIALEILDATTLVGTVLGAAGVAGLIVGFAFRDIAENYLASLLLAGRRPFGIGDLVQIGECCGKVMRLTTRQTVLITLEGNHLSIPNATVFKSTVLNLTRNPRRRFDFVVGAGVDADLREAQRLGVETTRSTPGVVADPPPFALIEELGESNVAIRFHGWIDQREADFLKVRSEAIRRAKSALEDAGIDLPEPIFRVRVQEAGPMPRPAPSPEAADGVDVSPDQTIDREVAAHEAEEENLLRRNGS